MVSSRGFLRDVLADERIQEILNEQYSDTELNEFFSVLEKDIKHEKMFIEVAKQLRDFYAKKSKKLNKKKPINA